VEGIGGGIDGDAFKGLDGDEASGSGSAFGVVTFDEDIGTDCFVAFG
jgi:hypothetical protein